MRDPLLIDECLSAALVAVAKARGYSADYAPHIGMSGWQDWNLISFALDRNYVVVTNNRRDFLREYAKHDFHNGLIVIVPSGERDMQIELFSLALDMMHQRGDDIMNMIIEIFEDGRVEVREWTAAAHDPVEIQRKR